MCKVEDLFYKPDEGKAIEGYLGEEAKEECKILFVLREPHEDNPDGFWFNEKVVNPKPQEERQGQRYFKSFGTLAYKLLGGKDDSPCDCKLEEALRHCAYINIYPFSGESNASNQYYCALAALKRAESVSNEPIVLEELDKKNYERIAMNRLQIIQNMDWKILVTVCGVFEAITNREAKDCPKGITVGYKSGKQPDKEFRFAYYNNDCNKRIVSFYHPSHPCSCNVENEYLNIPCCLKLSVLDC